LHDYVFPPKGPWTLEKAEADWEKVRSALECFSPETLILIRPPYGTYISKAHSTNRDLGQHYAAGPCTSYHDGVLEGKSKATGDSIASMLSDSEEGSIWSRAHLIDGHGLSTSGRYGIPFDGYHYHRESGLHNAMWHQILRTFAAADKYMPVSLPMAYDENFDLGEWWLEQTGGS
jgi:hypothetical protein